MSEAVVVEGALSLGEREGLPLARGALSLGEREGLPLARGALSLGEREGLPLAEEIVLAQESPHAPIVADRAVPVAVEFVHLAVHSEYSVSDGLLRVKELATRAADLNMPAVALTDLHLFGLVKFQTACQDAGVKAILGADLRFAQGDELRRCSVLVTDREGYRNLLALESSAYVDPDTGHGTVDATRLRRSGTGLAVLLGADSDVGHALASDRVDEAAQALAAWRESFGDRVYVQVVRTGRPGENEFVLQAAKFAARWQVPLVASNDVRFLTAEDFEAHETRVCIQDGRVLNDPRRERRYSPQQYLRSGAEMADVFADLPEAIDNAVELARRCTHEMHLGEYFLPKYPVPPGQTLETLLELRAREGLQARSNTRRADMPDADYGARLDYELDIIKRMGFAGYFLIVQEFVNWAKQNDVPVGPGRGSGAASLVAYSLGITDLDPLEYDLLFERLLNPERVSMPDFDIDFCMEKRDRVIAHVAELYGRESVSQIATFGTMAARGVVRDVARVQGKPFGLADRLSKMIPFEVGMTLAKAVEQEEELRDFIAGNDEVAEIMEMAEKLEGIVRNVGKHAGGVVIAPRALTDFVPLYADEAGEGVVSQFDLYDVEQAGLVKFDFLGLKTLTIIDWAAAAINEERAALGEAPVDVQNLPLDDPDTYAFLKTAQTTAIFQLESTGMKDLIRRLQPDSIDDITALVALYRPGPLQSGAVDQYVDRKHGRAPVTYPHPSLTKVLGTTYGVMLYQEQVMSGAQELAGFSLGQADLLRRAMGKKKPEEMAEMRAMFLDGAREQEVDEGIASGIFDQMEKFAGYAFNKAHSAGYALLTYQTAWLKAHYPAHFMSAVLSADMGDTDKVVALVDEAHRMGLAVQPPDLNESAYRFRAVPCRNGSGGGSRAILYGLGAVRGVGEGPVESIRAEIEAGGRFSDLGDFCRRVDAKKANKRVVEALIRAGAMDGFATNDENRDMVRARLLDDLPTTMQGAEQAAHGASAGMQDLFGGVEATPRHPDRPPVAPLSWRERLDGEKAALGLYLTGHPIEAYLDEIRAFCPNNIASLTPNRGVTRRVAGLVVSERTRRSRRGDPMSFVVLDDRSGRLEVSVFGELMRNHRQKLAKDAVLVFEGEVLVDDRNGSNKLRASSIETIEEARRRYARSVCIRLDGDAGPEPATALREAIGTHLSADGCPLVVDYRGNHAAARIALGDAWRVDASDEVLAALRSAFGEAAVTLDFPG